MSRRAPRRLFARRRPPRPRPARVLLLAVLLAVAGCGRLERVGQEPEFTPAGAPANPAPPPSPRRVAIAAPPPNVETHAVASLWRSGPSSLFGDRRAKGLGDLLTVVIDIDDEAEIANQTSRSRAANEDLGVSALFGVPGIVSDQWNFSTDPAVGVTAGSAYQGQGGVSREEEITLRIAVTVVDVLPNGHFVIAGNQEVRVNFELRDLQVSGIIRPEDISRRNEIGYDRIAEARIAYGGRGQIYDVQQPRYGQQVVDILLPY